MSCVWATTTPCNAPGLESVDGKLLAEKDLVVLIDRSEYGQYSSRADKKANGTLVWIRHSVASRTRAVRLHLESHVQFWPPSLKRDIEVLERGQRRAEELVKGLEHKCDGERLRDLRGFSLEKRRLRGTLLLSTTA